jgi:hypothetical protein
LPDILLPPIDTVLCSSSTPPYQKLGPSSPNTLLLSTRYSAPSTRYRSSSTLPIGYCALPHHIICSLLIRHSAPPC